MKTQEQKIEECIQFVQQNVPRWIFHQELTDALDLHDIRFVPEYQMRGNRGYALERAVRVSSVTSKWRSSSPYTSPCGKSDLSPLGVMCHELGHVLDFACTRMSVDFHSEWVELHSDNRREAITSYAKTNWREDLAESNRLFMLNPKLLKELSPKRFEAIAVLYKNVVDTYRPWSLRVSERTFNQQFAKLVR